MTDKSLNEVNLGIALIVGNIEAGIYTNRWLYPVDKSVADIQYDQLKAEGLAAAKGNQNSIRENVEEWEAYSTPDYVHVFLISIPANVADEKSALEYVKQSLAIDKPDYDELVQKYFGKRVSATGESEFSYENLPIADALNIVGHPFSQT